MRFPGRIGIWFLCVTLTYGVGTSPAAEESRGQLQRMKYRHPGLIDDLAVGLWSWPVPIDADGDGDTDMIISCEDTPYNGTYLFTNPAKENGESDTEMAIPFRAARRLSQGVINVQLSWVNGTPRILTPAKEYPDFVNSGVSEPVDLGVPANVHRNNVRGNMWKYVDYEDDGLVDLIVGSDDWTDYGWDDAWTTNGVWKNGPLRGNIYVLRNQGTNESPKYADAVLLKLVNGNPIETFGWPSPEFRDWDDDGDLDLLCGDFRDRFSYFENVGSRTDPRYVGPYPVGCEGNIPAVIDLAMATPVAFDLDRDGRVDLLCGDED
ncbi:MAG: FG-GAP-like repeat-containing protein, partial [Planctomycetia bacterium]|nr:FG-GAP-like repeat-containing protein [Planctomycetia bacterium]